MKIVSVRDILHCPCVHLYRKTKKPTRLTLQLRRKKGLKRRSATETHTHTHVWNDNNSANGEGKLGRHPGKFNEPGWGMIDIRITVPNTTTDHHLGVFFFSSWLAIKGYVLYFLRDLILKPAKEAEKKRGNCITPTATLGFRQRARRARNGCIFCCYWVGCCCVQSQQRERERFLSMDVVDDVIDHLSRRYT